MGEQTGQMVPLDIAPGAFTEDTDRGSKVRWKDLDKVRFKNGLPQSIGGWVGQTLTGETILGTARSSHDWAALDGTKYAAIGTEKRLYILETSFALTNITPVRDTNNLTDPFLTDNTGLYDPENPTRTDASYFRVSDTTHGCNVGDIVNFSGFTSPVGGITVNGDFEVLEIVDANTYTLKGDTAATSTVAGGGGTGTYIYEISVGLGLSGSVSGWGAGAWSESTWNTPREGSTLLQELRTWSLDNWGEDLVASPRGGTLYQWDKSVGLGTRAQEVTQAPDTIQKILVSSENRQIIALGAHTGTSSDKLFVRWCDSEDFTNWTPAVSNTAGDKRIDQGSELITGIKTRVGILLFTDESAHIMQPVGSNDIYSFREVGTGVGIAGPHAAADANGVVYMMGKTSFYIFDGLIRPLPCEIWTKVYEDFNTTQASGVVASHSKDFNEVWFFYPSAMSSLNDRYAIYNYIENVWYFGELDRSTFHDFSSFLGKPYGVDSSGTFYTHEDGVDANGAAMSPYIESYDADIAEGDQLIHVSKMIPDFKRLDGNVSLDLKGRKRPEATQQTKTYSLSPTTDAVSVRMRARQIAIRISQSGIGDSFRMGTWRARAVPDGER